MLHCASSPMSKYAEFPKLLNLGIQITLPKVITPCIIYYQKRVVYRRRHRPSLFTSSPSLPDKQGTQFKSETTFLQVLICKETYRHTLLIPLTISARVDKCPLCHPLSVVLPQLLKPRLSLALLYK